jgi:hypothetical protein
VERHGRPVHIVDLAELPSPSDAHAVAAARGSLEEQRVETLNVAGPRGSGAPGIGSAALAFLRALLERA